ncbi:MAG: triose-phosphate isomerase [Fluviicola sp. XM-24bin1]|nr:MAG: triose-phosphate isomerase [Fluviicola sp. XM-24bin1]
MAQKIVAGNWKMNLNLNDAKALVQNVNQQNKREDVTVMMFPPALFVADVAAESNGIKVGTQNFYFEEKGAFTGEVAIDQIRSVGGEIALIGHSERRSIFGESDALLKQKVDAAVSAGFDFIFCCGEPLEIREAGTQEEYVKAQLEAALFHLPKEAVQDVVIAYEPVWAIGTGKTATSDQAEEMHAAIRSWIVDSYDQDTAEKVSILYGGSCNENNAKELFSCPNVDGGLIGGASLKADAFCAIIDSF